MKHCLLPMLFIISTSFCPLSAETNVPDLLQSNNASQQNSVITLDVQPTADQDAFFKSLIKDIKSDRVEYKDGKIFIYITPPLAATILPVAFGIIPILSAVSYAIWTLDIHNIIVRFATSMIVTTLNIFLGTIVLSASLDNCLNRWVEENPLITIEKDGIRYQKGSIIPWSTIKNIVQHVVNVDDYADSNIKLICTDASGIEVFRISEYNFSPITFEETVELIYKAFYHAKQKQAHTAYCIPLVDSPK